MSTYLITGGSGFLGSALAAHFEGAGHRVCLLARTGSKFDRLTRDGRSLDRFTIGRYDSDASLREFVQACAPDVVLHTACNYGRAGQSMLDILDSNVRYGVLVLEAARAAARVSSSSAPGANVRPPLTFINTGTALDAAVSPYALSKHQFSDWGRMTALSAPTEIRFVNVVLQHMYGPFDDESKFSTFVLRSCAQHREALPLTAGEQRRDFVHVQDAVDAYAVLAEKAATLPVYLDIDVGSGKAPTVREFVETVKRVTGSRTRLDFGSLPYRATEPMLCQADLSAMAALGWAPRYDLDSGLRETIAQENQS